MCGIKSVHGTKNRDIAKKNAAHKQMQNTLKLYTNRTILIKKELNDNH
jgi:hypothetical protein